MAQGEHGEGIQVMGREPGPPPDKRLSKQQIAITCEIPYTTVCERLSGRRGVGKTGKIAGEKRRG